MVGSCLVLKCSVTYYDRTRNSERRIGNASKSGVLIHCLPLKKVTGPPPASWVHNRNSARKEAEC